MKPGDHITITWVRPEGDVKEPAKVARTTTAMLPLPAGYLPVRFEDGSVLLVARERIDPAHP